MPTARRRPRSGHHPARRPEPARRSSGRGAHGWLEDDRLTPAGWSALRLIRGEERHSNCVQAPANVLDVRLLCRDTTLESPTKAVDRQARVMAERVPRVWAILCYREGDNTQILALADALGWPYEVKRLAYRKWGYASDVLRGTTLAGIDTAASSPLQEPWPDLVISAAMRNEPVCRWIQRQAGKPVRYVHIGRPWARLRWFDLVVTMPEFRLPVRPNVLNNGLSLTRITGADLAEAATIWSPRFAHLPRPHIAVLVGGYAGPYALGLETARRLARVASAAARQAGGSLLVTTSHRTRPAAADALEGAIDVPAFVHRWRPRSPDNPYRGYLALADSFIVTCDSASMLTEACATRKPVYMFDL